ncbi:NAD(P)-binding Rossmann-fold superfamily protein [Artemisia annua]|uniref:NAD(P)-binding Rossmann-fold superfamily protein n=1 Tax=Artemisia annua TaxID=35608 RepID=A0A2U1MSC1_ARTAN|nr:NAD(P)-binding Rossmann-fold superfamily protein [Artemisia annua]
MECCCYSPTTNPSFKFLNPQSVPSSARLCSNPFLKVNDRIKSRKQSSYVNDLRTYKRRTSIVAAESKKQGWDFGRFVKTLYFFNGPPSPFKIFESLIANLSGPSSSEAEKSMDVSGIVLVAGATGGVGRRVVDILRKKGLPVRVLVRNEEKARKMLGPDVDLLLVRTFNLTHRRVLKFFVQDLSNDQLPQYGIVSTANNGGFTSIRTKNFDVAENLSAYDGLELRLKGDGRRYKLIVRTSRDWDTVGYTVGFDTVKDQWQSVQLPFSSLRPIFRAKTVADAQPFDPSQIISLQLMFSKFEYDGKLNPTFVEGPFELPVSSIRAYMAEPITPRFVHVGSAGVTRPERPGLDLSKQPPAVRLNKELGSILTFKLKGEDLIRESGIPYTIVRPCALTEEPAGADLIFEQGDNITGKISREEVAKICVAALESPYACDKTFEVKCVLPFSEQYTVDPENPPPEKDYNSYFMSLKDGITGKEALEKTVAAV